MGVAIDAGIQAIVRRVRMAVGAQRPIPLVSTRVNLEVLEIVVERGRDPRRRRVTGTAVVAEICRHMVGVRRDGVVRLVALVTIGQCQPVVPPRMAVLTLNEEMFSGQGEPRADVTEGGREERGGCMARRAVVSEHSGHVIRVRRALVVGRMALVAIRVRELVIVIRVAGEACRRQMGTGQDKMGRIVIECLRGPRRGAVARCAVMVEIQCNVPGVRRLLIIGLMALVTARIGELVVPPGMAEPAGRRRVRAGERKPGCAVIERGPQPRGRAVAVLAIVAESR